MADHYEALRHRMVDEQLVSRKISDPRVLAAMRTVPRHEFVRESDRAEAYDDHPLSIEEGQTISQPYIVALMVEAAQLGATDRVLEIGTGSGYAAAIAGECAAEVVTVERHPSLGESAAKRLQRLGFDQVHVVIGDGSLGYPEKAPYDAIIVTCAAPEPPEALLRQLADNGRLIVPVGERDWQELLRVTKQGDAFHREFLGSVRFVPLLGKEGF